MTEETKELQVIKTVGENGEEYELKLLDIVTVNDSDYALLMPKEADVDDEDAEIVLMRMEKDGDEYVFETIEDDDEFNAVAKAISDDDSCHDENCDCHNH